jgi:hypothetical protein
MLAASSLLMPRGFAHRIAGNVAQQSLGQMELLDIHD